MDMINVETIEETELHEASMQDSIHRDDEDRAFADDMARARSELRRDRIRQRRTFSRSPQRRARARARRTRMVIRVAVSMTTASDSPPGPPTRGQAALLAGEAF